MHVRQTIRDFFVTTLKNANVAMGNIFDSRVYAIANQDSESVIVFTKSEVAEVSTIGSPASTVRELTIEFEIYIKDVTDMAGKLDTIAAEIETEILGSCKPIPEITGMSYEGIEVEYASEGDKMVLTGTMEFLITYWLVDGLPEQLGV